MKGYVIRMSEEQIQKLTQKLQEQNDITLEEADWIYSVSKKREPTTALQEWYNVVAKEIEKGRSGNFIFTIPFFRPKHIFEKPDIPEYLKNVMEALRKHGKLSDRAYLLRVNEQAFSLFPKHIQELFEPSKKYDNSTEYILWASRMGFLRYPLNDSETNQTCTIIQFLKEKFYSPLLITEDYTIDAGLNNINQYALNYLIDNIPIAELRALQIGKEIGKTEKKPSFGEAVILVNKDKRNVLLSKKLLNISYPEMAQYSFSLGTLDEELLEIFSKSNTNEDYCWYEWFVKDCKKYIKQKAKEFQEEIERKLEQETARSAVENESEWLEISR